MGDVTHINKSPSKAEPNKLEEVVAVLAAAFALITTFGFDDFMEQDTVTGESLGCRRRTDSPCRALGAS